MTTHVLSDLSCIKSTRNQHKPSLQRSLSIYLLPSPQVPHFPTLVLQELTNLHHFTKFLQVAGNKVQEGKFVKVFGTLIAHFNNLVITLQQGHFSQLLPAVLVIQGFGCFQSNLKNSHGQCLVWAMTQNQGSLKSIAKNFPRNSLYLQSLLPFYFYQEFYVQCDLGPPQCSHPLKFICTGQSLSAYAVLFPICQL